MQIFIKIPRLYDHFSWLSRPGKWSFHDFLWHSMTGGQ